MARGTPEQDLDTYMDQQEQAEIELNEEEHYAEDLVYGISNVIENIKHNIVDTESEVELHGIERELIIRFSLSDVEMEMLQNYLDDHAPKYVAEKVERL
tara:strand:+ start:560 stop:856 length:297 start_codon:yes stop_codon:yes gene_type:complete